MRPLQVEQPPDASAAANPTAAGAVSLFAQSGKYKLLI